MIATALWLAGFARKAAQGLWALASRYPLQCALIGLLCLSGWLWTTRGDALDALETQRVQNEALVRSYQDAQREVAIRSLAAKAAAESRYKELSDNADHEADRLRIDLRNAADRYADAHGVRTACTASSASSGTVAAAKDSIAPDRDGPGADAVVLSRDDFDTLTGNTARLVAVREWALGL